MRCGACGVELLPGKTFCHACGGRARQACAECGAPAESGFRFCPDCGAPLPGAEVAEDPSAPRAQAVDASAPADPVQDRLTRHLPEALAAKIRATGAVSGERKRATVLFCDLVGSTAIAEQMDPEEYRELLDRYLELALREIYRFEGIVNQLAGDGFMALFGAPIAHEDDPERAVCAALAIQSELRKLSSRLEAEGGALLATRIGIHTGTVVAGTVGNDLKMDYTAIGDTTNLAARLQAIAEPGTVLASEATHRLLGSGVRSHPIGPLDIKGRSEAVTAHRIEAFELGLSSPAIARSEGLTALVGRREELAQLEACYERASGGLAQVVWVVGDAGTGKSRLVYEFRERLEKDGVTILEARGSALNRGVTFAPWVGMLRRHLGIGVDDDPEEVRRKVLEGAGDRPSETAIGPQLLSILGLSADRDTPLDELKGSWFLAFETLVRRLGRRGPLVMIIEDLHWVDDASLEILDLAISRFQGHEMLLVTHRPHYTREWRSTNAALTQLHLSRLRDRDAARIVRARAGGPLPLELEMRILARGEGNPLFLEELTKGLVEEGTLIAGNGRVQVTRPVDEISIPDTLQDLLGARLDRLTPSAKRVAQLASVLGRQFRRDHLAALLESESIDVDTGLKELERLGVLHRKLGLSHDEFRFGESLTQEVAYEGLLLRERRALHGRVGELLEGGAEMAPRQLPLLAHHFSRSDDRLKGVRLMLDAAREAEEFPSYTDALRLYQEAWDLAEAMLQEGGSEELERLTLASARGVALVVMGQGPGPRGFETQERAIRRGTELAERLGDAEARARLYSARAGLIMTRGPGRFAEALELSTRSIDVARAARLPVLAATLERNLSSTYLVDGRFEEALTTVDAALEQLRAAGAEETADAYVGAHFFKSRVLVESDRFDTAERQGLHTFELALRANNRTIQSSASALLTGLYFLAGNYPEAERWAGTALRAGESIQSAVGIGSASAVGLALRIEGGDRLARAAEFERLDRGLEIASDLSFNLEVIIEALLLAGELERAHQVAVGQARYGGGRLRVARHTFCLGQVMFALGPDSWAEAERHLNLAAERATEIGARSILGKAFLELAQLDALRGDRPAAHARAEAARDLFRELGMGRYEAQAQGILVDHRREQALRA